VTPIVARAGGIAPSPALSADSTTPPSRPLERCLMLPRLIPLETLFGNPTQVSPRLSPDGRLLAWVAPLDGVLNVWTRLADGGEATPLTHDTGRGVQHYEWAEDGLHLLYIQDKDGDENWHLYAVRLTDNVVRDLTPFENIQAQFVDAHPSRPDCILVATNQRDAAMHDVYEVTLSTGARTMVAENPGDVLGWVADTGLKVRGAAAQTPEGGWDIRVRDADDGPWHSVHTVGPEDEAVPYAFTEDGTGLYLTTTQGADTKRMVLLDVASGRMSVLAEREDVDVGGALFEAGGALFHPVTNKLQAVAFARHRTEWELLDESIRPDFEALRKAEDGDFGVASRANDDSLWIVAYVRDVGSTRYYLYSRADRSATFLFAARPEIDAFALAPMQPVDISARDGLVLPSYLTLPVGVEPTALPLVLDVHGGPWARDSWGYHPHAQWFANRGYACLQVNFRASTGFGKAFMHAGDREWGGKMLDDLVDAVRWAVDKGIADPKRLAIFGGSYGGYATLSALAFRPEVFACGVDIVGPSNLITLLESIPPYWEPLRKVFDNRLGHLERDAEFLKSRSPLFSVESITKPLLIAQGANVPRVAQAESEQMVAALREAGKPVEYMLFPDEGHGFARPENRLKFYAAAEDFLAKYLGGRTE
jgi:dipeptidyl aminopeptidase/acylaminoacyl peptidase